MKGDFCIFSDHRLKRFHRFRVGSCVDAPVASIILRGESSYHRSRSWGYVPMTISFVYDTKAAWRLGVGDKRKREQMHRRHATHEAFSFKLTWTKHEMLESKKEHHNVCCQQSLELYSHNTRKAIVFKYPVPLRMFANWSSASCL